MTPQKISVLSLDEHEVVLYGLRLLVSQEADIEFDAARTPKVFLEKVRQLQPDVTLHDLMLFSTDYGHSGLEVLPEVKRLSAKTKRIVFTSFASAVNLRRALRYEVEGFLDKERTSGQELISAIRRVAAGEHIYLHDPAQTPSRGSQTNLLTEREKDVVRLVLQYGWTNPAIAKHLGIGTEAVKSHLKHASAKLGARDRFDLALKAQQLGLL